MDNLAFNLYGRQDSDKDWDVLIVILNRIYTRHLTEEETQKQTGEQNKSIMQIIRVGLLKFYYFDDEYDLPPDHTTTSGRT